MSYDKEVVCAIEAFIFTAVTPISVPEIKKLLQPEYKLTSARVMQIISDLQGIYKDRALNLIHTANGYRFQTKPELAIFLQKQHAKSKPKYSKAFLEVLAIIVYKQPVTKADIERIRGVSIGSYILNSMIEMGWVRIVGRKEVLGRPSLYGTTKELLDYFCVNAVSDLTGINLSNICNLKEEIL